MFHNLSGMTLICSSRSYEKIFNKDDTGVVVENKKKYISFNVKINVKLAVLTNKDGKK